jgi:hypothetical protein
MKSASTIFLGTQFAATAPARTTLALSAATTRLALSFVCTQSGTLNKVMAYATAVAGSLVGGDLGCDIYSDNPAVGPNAVVTGGTSTTVTATPTGAAWVEFTGLSAEITAGVQYWVVLRNLAAVPATNYPTFGFVSGLPVEVVGGHAFTPGWHKRQSTDGGVTWATSPAFGNSSLRLEFAGGLFGGFPYETTAAANTALIERIYADRKAGVSILTPSGPTINVISAQFLVLRGTNPTFGLQCQIYQGTSLVATSLEVDKALLVSSSSYFYRFVFPSAVALSPGVAYRFVLCEPTGTDNTGSYYAVHKFVVQNSAASKALTPFGGSKFTYWDGTAWTDTDTAFVPVRLGLNPGAEFTVAEASGGGSGSSVWVG